MRMTIMLAVCCIAAAAAWAADRPAPSHGIGYPEGWQDWAAIAVAHRTDNDTVRLIVGNDAAVKAARSGQTNPWPDGAILGKVVWKAVALDAWQEAKVPGELVHAEFMFKDAGKYAGDVRLGLGPLARAGAEALRQWAGSLHILPYPCAGPGLGLHEAGCVPEVEPAGPWAAT